MRVLVVEDSSGYLKIYRTIIKRMGHESVIATSGIEALNIVKNSQDFDIVLLDLHLPDFNGMDLCELMREILDTKSTYFILITGDNSTEVHRQVLDAGADDFLTKPIDLGILESRIKVGVRSVVTAKELKLQQRLAEELSIENELYRQGFNESNQPVIYADTDGIITHINSSLIDFYGYSEDQLIGKKTSIFNAGRKAYEDKGISSEEYSKIFRELWESLLNRDIGVWEGYIFNKTAKGVIKETHLRVSSLRAPNGDTLGYIAYLLDVSEILKRERNIRYACYKTIVDLAEVRDNETGEHLIRMSKYSGLLAEKLACGNHYVNKIKQFAPFHDIGKVGIPDSILLAPRKLTKDEFELIKNHSKIGYDILKEAETLEFAAEIANSHHEKYNGKGYPQGLSGEEIPLSGRIIALADVYDALRSKRPYKEPWDHEKVVELIKSERGEHFDPTIVDVFLENEQEFFRISEKYMEKIKDNKLVEIKL